MRQNVDGSPSVASARLVVVLAVAAVGIVGADAAQLDGVAGMLPDGSPSSSRRAGGSRRPRRASSEQAEQQRPAPVRDVRSRGAAALPAAAARRRDRRLAHDHRPLVALLRVELVPDGLELGDHLVHRRGALGGLLRERALDQRREAERRVGPRVEHARHRIVDVLHRDREEVVARVGHRRRPAARRGRRRTSRRPSARRPARRGPAPVRCSGSFRARCRSRCGRPRRASGRSRSRSPSRARRRSGARSAA